jgi:hypothetical protein
MHVSQVQLWFNTSVCAVQSVTQTTVTCMVGAAPGGVAGAAVLTIVPSLGAPATTFPSVKFTYAVASTPVVQSVTPWRGSTEVCMAPG